MLFADSSVAWDLFDWPPIWGHVHCRRHYGILKEGVHVAVDYLFTDTYPGVLPTEDFLPTRIVDRLSDHRARRKVKVPERSVKKVGELYAHF